jgi:hypothetical protein
VRAHDAGDFESGVVLRPHLRRDSLQRSLEG